MFWKHLGILTKLFFIIVVLGLFLMMTWESPIFTGNRDIVPKSTVNNHSDDYHMINFFPVPSMY